MLKLALGVLILWLISYAHVSDFAESAGTSACVKNKEIAMHPELSYEKAHELAVKLANEEFNRKEFVDPATNKKIKASFTALSGGKKAGRWEFYYGPPAGKSARVCFALDGSNPEVEVGWSNA